MTLAPPDALDDATLAMAAARGSQSAFSAIYDRYADRLHDFCIGMLRDHHAAADCVQDTFVTAATKLVQLREPERLRPWLYAIARHEALSRIRDQRREMPSDDLPEYETGEPDLATLAARSELADLIAEACGGLTERDRTVFELAYRHGLDGPELADALGVTHTNANTLVGRLRETVERSLGALLVCRAVRADPRLCPELAALIEHWDGKFTVLMRKRAARHIDNCALCEAERGHRVNPVALLGSVPLFIPAPVTLRDSTLGDAFAEFPADLHNAPTEAFTAPGEPSWWPPEDLDTKDLAADTATAPLAFARDPAGTPLEFHETGSPETGSDGRSVKQAATMGVLVALAVLGLGVVLTLSMPLMRVQPVSVPESLTTSVVVSVIHTTPPTVPSRPSPVNSAPARTIDWQSPAVVTSQPSPIPEQPPVTTTRTGRTTTTTPQTTTTSPTTTTTTRTTTTTTTPTSTTTTTSSETSTTTTTSSESTTTTTTTTTDDDGGGGGDDGGGDPIE
jgi:RNA polymerase sigma factor (sigma-70 family)